MNFSIITLTVLEYGANSFPQALVIAWLMSLRWKITSETAFGGILEVVAATFLTRKPESAYKRFKALHVSDAM